MTNIEWTAGQWTTPPPRVDYVDEGMRVLAAEESDAWRRTAYGFVHDTEHALLAPFEVGTAMEVEFEADFAAEFDQAGIFVRASEERWMKTGVEFADGVLGAGAVVTDVFSDWSTAPVPEWQGRRILVRASRWSDALIVRMAADGGPLRLVRIAPFPGELAASAGPLVSAPTRADLEVSFTAWRYTTADTAIH